MKDVMTVKEQLRALAVIKKLDTQVAQNIQALNEVISSAFEAIIAIEPEVAADIIQQLSNQINHESMAKLTEERLEQFEEYVEAVEAQEENNKTTH